MKVSIDRFIEDSHETCRDALYYYCLNEKVRGSSKPFSNMQAGCCSTSATLGPNGGGWYTIAKMNCGTKTVTSWRPRHSETNIQISYGHAMEYNAIEVVLDSHARGSGKGLNLMQSACR